MDIIFEHQNFIAVNKAAGMLSIPDRAGSGQSLKELLLKKYGEIFTVHRLDKFTSGLIIFAKDAATHKALSEKFQSREVEKFYLGLVNGHLHPPEGTVNAAIAEHPAKNGKMVVNAKGKPSRTDYKTVEAFRGYSLVEFNIHTGRTHQIRVHTQYLGASIVCDELYGDGKPVYLSQIKRNYKLSKQEEEERPVLSRLALHSHRLHFTLHDIEYRLEAPLPKDLRALLQQLRKQ